MKFSLMTPASLASIGVLSALPALSFAPSPSLSRPSSAFASTSLRPRNRVAGRARTSILMMSDTETASPDDTSGTLAVDAATATVRELLSRPARPGRPLKVAIAGGGVGGLTAALCMLRAGFDVTVYERTSAFARFGGPIQFASNALSVLKEIDDTLFERIMEKFTFTGTRACGIKDGLRADGSFRMTDDNLAYLFDDTAPADWFVKFPLKQCADLYGLPYTGVIDRPDLQEILIDECQKIKPDFIRNSAGVVSYVDLGKGNGVDVSFEDGTETRADVLVGADGIWSAVRNQMYDEGGVKNTSADQLKRQGCNYSGYTVFAGETVINTPDYYETGYKVYIGPKRYFVTSDVGDGRVQWYAFFALPPGSKQAPSGWGGNDKIEKEAGADLVQYIKSLHEGWTTEIMDVLDATPPETVEQRDLYDRSPELLRSWAKGNVVLMGDAVHPMMPNLGQGGCQAIEDAFVLTKILDETKSTDKIQDSLQEFYRTRILRVSIVQFLSRLASDLIINAFDTPWSPHDDKGTNWKSYLTFFWKPLLQYVIFPGQFAYLYSYYPSGSMGELPAQLEEKWKKVHVESAEKEFERVAAEGQDVAKPSFFGVAAGVNAVKEAIGAK